MTAKDTLIKARELLQVPGVWDTGMLVNGDCMCLLGAVGIAEGLIPSDGDTDDTDTVYRELEASPAVAALVSNIQGVFRSKENIKIVYWFNDTKNRTLDEVLELLDKTIATVV
jgi:hypothetical protein